LFILDAGRFGTPSLQGTKQALHAHYKNNRRKVSIFSLYACYLIKRMMHTNCRRLADSMLTNISNLMEDKLLWDKFLAGDDKAYAYFYKKYVKELFSYGMRFTPDKELVKDCIQDVFVKLYSNRSTLNGTDHVKLYLFIALKNTLFNIFQKDKSSYHIDTVEPVFSTDYTVEDCIIADEQEKEWKEKMARILESLSPRQKEVIYYRYVEGMELKDICELMDMNYQSIQNLIQRAIKKVRRFFDEKDRSVLSIKRISRCL
jgi:RNA polymerase sigma factor (sigma-70 family)